MAVTCHMKLVIMLLCGALIMTCHSGQGTNLLDAAVDAF